MTRYRTLLVLLLCIAFVAVPATGMHLHLCFDGAEPAASLHLTGDSGIHQPGAGPTHEDIDLSLIGEMLGKLSKSGFDLPVLLLAFALTLLLTRASTPTPRPVFRSGIVSSPRFILPPLRGPPR